MVPKLVLRARVYELEFNKLRIRTAISLVPSPRAPPGEKRSGERSRELVISGGSRGGKGGANASPF